MRCESRVFIWAFDHKLLGVSSTASLNIGTYLTRAAEQVPHRPALVHGESRATYAEEELRVNALAQALKSLGIEKGDRASG